MNPSVTLYDFKDENIHINIEAYFQNENLIIDGYDIGKTVKEAWGDSDYEYILTIHQKNVSSLYTLLHIAIDDKETLLKELALRFHDNHCFTRIEEFLTSHHIPYERFTWT